MNSGRQTVSPGANRRPSFAEILAAENAQRLQKKEVKHFKAKVAAAPEPQKMKSYNGQQAMSYAQVAAAATVNQSTNHKDEEWEDYSSLLQDEGAAAVSEVENFESDEVIALMLQLELDKEQEETAEIMSGMNNSNIDEALAASLVEQEEIEKINRRNGTEETIAKSLQTKPEGNRNINKWQRKERKLSGSKAKVNKPK